MIRNKGNTYQIRRTACFGVFGKTSLTWPKVLVIGCTVRLTEK